MRNREMSNVRQRRAPKRKELDTSGPWKLRSRNLGGGSWRQELKNPAGIFLALKDT